MFGIDDAIFAVLAAGGGLANTLLKPKQTPGVSTFNNTTQANQSNTSQRILTGEQQEALAGLSDWSKRLMSGDASGRLAPIRDQLRSNVNRNYAGVEAGLKAKYGRGDARSGVLGRGQREMEMSRAQALSGADMDFARMLIEDQDKGIGLAERLLNQIFGTHTSGESGQTASGTSTATQPWMQQNPWGAGIGGGLDTLTTFMMLNKMLQGNKTP